MIEKIKKVEKIAATRGSDNIIVFKPNTLKEKTSTTSDQNKFKQQLKNKEEQLITKDLNENKLPKTINAKITSQELYEQLKKEREFLLSIKKTFPYKK